MKYQDILNKKVLFETNNAHEFMQYLMKKENTQSLCYTLINLLQNSKGYTCNMASAIGEQI